MPTACGLCERKGRLIPSVPKYRSKFEEKFAVTLANLALKAIYEKDNIKYTVPETIKTYHPDWYIGPRKYIETKGRFTAYDRSKTLWVRKSNPEITVYLLFQDSRKTLSKKSRTTYGDWCDKHDIPWADIKDIDKWKGWFND
ncbi:MAG TPA: hypothetical protein VFM18_15615 [Methanosarcina sp.]|nr:hypothetical protein [Methanosarcina sp.]